MRLAAILGAVLLAWPLAALGQEAACRREGDRVSCVEAGFKTLTDAAVKARAEAATCTLRLEDTAKDVGARETALHACEAALAAVPRPPEKPKATRFIVGYAAGVASTVALLTGALAPLPDAARLTLGGAGLVGLAGGVVLVLP